MLRYNLLITLALFAFSAGAAMAPVGGAKNWTNVEEVDPVLQTPVCRAYTQSSDSSSAVEFSISYPKDGKSVPAIFLKTALAAPWASVLSAGRGREGLFLLHASTGAGDLNVFWYAPVNFVGLLGVYWYLRSARRLST